MGRMRNAREFPLHLATPNTQRLTKARLNIKYFPSDYQLLGAFQSKAKCAGKDESVLPAGWVAG